MDSRSPATPTSAGFRLTNCDAWRKHSKSAHRRLIHSRGSLCLSLRGDVLDRCGDRRLMVEPSQLVWPGTVDVQWRYHIRHQTLQAFAAMVARAQIMHIRVAEGSQCELRNETVSASLASACTSVYGAPGHCFMDCDYNIELLINELTATFDRATPAQSRIISPEYLWLQSGPGHEEDKPGYFGHGRKLSTPKTF